ncbi:MAG: hypothetical protein JWQ31_945, partial [Mycobacterium sp.]|nr:hypothetical protein [Mycobacterium sp.]
PADMFTPRASASTSSGCAYSRSILSRTRRKSLRSRRCCPSAAVLVTYQIVVSYVKPTLLRLAAVGEAGRRGDAHACDPGDDQCGAAAAATSRKQLGQPWGRPQGLLLWRLVLTKGPRRLLFVVETLQRNGIARKVYLRRRIGDGGDQSRSECAPMVEQGRGADGNTVRCPMRVRLYTDPLVSG